MTVLLWIVVLAAVWNTVRSVRHLLALLPRGNRDFALE